MEELTGKKSINWSAGPDVYSKEVAQQIVDTDQKVFANNRALTTSSGSNTLMGANTTLSCVKCLLQQRWPSPRFDGIWPRHLLTVNVMKSRWKSQPRQNHLYFNR